jgi:hypothetical protein
MAKARREVELAVRVGNKTGALGEILHAISRADINILAYCCYSDREQGVVLLVAEDALAARLALEAAGYTCRPIKWAPRRNSATISARRGLTFFTPTPRRPAASSSARSSRRWTTSRRCACSKRSRLLKRPEREQCSGHIATG